MKIKQLLLSFVTLSVFLISCSKEEINGVNIQPKESIEQTTVQSTTISTQNARISSETNLKAYVFIERQSRTTTIVNYLKTIPRNPQSTGIPFYSCFTMVSLQTNNHRDLINYLNMPFWTNGVLPQVIQTDVPQVSGGVDSYGNPKTAYNFTTVKIPKGTVNELSWVLVLVPVSAMNNDTRRQNSIGYYASNGVRITSSANNTQTVINTNKSLSSHLINYTGNIIPQGLYRVYSTYNNMGMRIGFNSSNDVYLRGFSN
jgi:hypothetical protein